MLIGCVGTDHSRAPLALRERLAVEGESLDTLLEALKSDPDIAEAAILSTCNRVEIYVAAADVPAALAQAVRHLLAATGVSAVEVAGVLERWTGRDAVRHLCAVAAGLCSLALGETQILTQVRTAVEHAAQRAAAGPELQALGRLAVRCGKQVRSETTLGQADTSISGLVVAMARQRLGDLTGRSALLIGAGRINAVSARLLREAGIGSLVAVSRTYAASARLAALCGGRAGLMEDLSVLLAATDIAVVATRAPWPLVDPATIRPRDPARPLLLYDIAVPRNVDPAVAALPGVELVDMDGLRAAIPGGKEPDGGERGGISSAWAIVEAAVERHAMEMRLRRAVPLIAGLRAHVDQQKEAELARTLAGLAHLPPADRAAVEMLAHRLVNRMFHHLTTRIKLAATEPDADAYLAALSFLFAGAGPEAVEGAGADTVEGASTGEGASAEDQWIATPAGELEATGS